MARYSGMWMCAKCRHILSKSTVQKRSPSSASVCPVCAAVGSFVTQASREFAEMANDLLFIAYAGKLRAAGYPITSMACSDGAHDACNLRTEEEKDCDCHCHWKSNRRSSRRRNALRLGGIQLGGGRRCDGPSRQHKLSPAQRLLTLLLFPFAGSMERESRSWMATCRCGHSKSIWERGGIRWLAAGEPRRLAFCDSCGGRTCHRVHRVRRLPY